jgi:hypothetical protein
MQLKIFIIHTQDLIVRGQKLEILIKNLKAIGKDCGYTVNTTLIIQPDASILQPQIETLQKVVSYDQVGDPDFDKLTQILSLEMLSNFEKHKEVWRKIKNSASESESENDTFYLVLEDDTILLNECVENLKSMLNLIKERSDWDLIMLGLSNSIDPRDKQTLVSTDKLKLFPSKESYLIRKKVATKMLEDFGIYRFTFRIQLSWYIYNNKDIRTFHPLKRVFIDGSKLGLFPSSINSNNVLVFNSEYMFLYEMLSKTKEEIIANMDKINKIYDTVKPLNNPDFQHIYGLIKIKADMLQDGEASLLLAVDQMKATQGILNSRSDLSNNLIELYKHLQPDLDTLLNLPSKYGKDCSLILP